MKLTVLGCGTMASIKYRNSTFLIEDEESKESLLFDAGFDLKFSLAENKVDVSKIKNIYVSHGHSDHIGGLEYLGFMTYFNPNLEKPKLIAHHSILRRIWKDALCFGMESIETRQLPKGVTEANLHTYFKPISVKDNKAFKIGNNKFYPVQTIHIVSGFNFMDSYGLYFISEKNKKVFISSDTQFSPSQLKGILEEADIIFHDCETSPFKTGVHAHYNELKTLDIEIKNKMYLYHYGDNVDETWRNQAIEDGFKGFVENGRVYNL